MSSKEVSLSRKKKYKEFSLLDLDKPSGLLYCKPSQHSYNRTTGSLEQQSHLSGVIRENTDGVFSFATQQTQHGVLLEQNKVQNYLKGQGERCSINDCSEKLSCKLSLVILLHIRLVLQLPLAVLTFIMHTPGAFCSCKLLVITYVRTAFESTWLFLTLRKHKYFA